MKNHILFTVVWLQVMMGAIVLAGDLEMVWVPSEGPVQGGGTLVLNLYLHNPTDATLTRELPRSIPCRIETGQTSVLVNADISGNAAESRAEVPGRGFIKRQYTLALPVFARGPVSIVPESADMQAIIVSIDRAPPEAWGGQQVPLDEGPTMIQSFLDNLAMYNPMYFLLGVSPGLEQSKFQFSFKYRLFNPEGYLIQKAPWLSGFNLAYTQRAIWDLKNDSKPFEDTSYMPELFYLLPKIDLSMNRVSAFGIQGGFEHLSNGKDGQESRSTNYLYVKPVMSVHLFGPYHLKIAPKFFANIFNDNETNPDLKDYIGYFDLEMGILDPEGLALDAHLWWAAKGATLQLDATFPMTKLLSNSLNLYLQAQYFSGYAETLIHYNERVDAFRLGIAIVR